jgi:hypothetical protein
MLTRSAVLRHLGPIRVDDHVVVEIIRTGATEEELIEALSRLQRGGEIGAEKMKPRSPRVARLWEILSTAIGNWDDLESR